MARVAAVGPAHGWEEAGTTTRETVEALVAKERPGWRVVDFIEVNNESGPSFEVTIENGGARPPCSSARGADGRIGACPTTRG